jgi:intracellular sulfur oxidation DsrE/DsrF family protein
MRALSRFLTLTLATAALPTLLAAQVTPGMQRSGPVIESAGPTFGVVDPSFTLPEDHTYRVVWEIVEGASEPDAMDPELGTVARFYNLHARHGVPNERIRLAAVVHGGGWRALLNEEAYAKRFDGGENASLRLVEELVANGVEIVLCGQTAGSREIAQEDLIPGVTIAWSAMTALHWFQSQGYTYNPW